MKIYLLNKLDKILERIVLQFQKKLKITLHFKIQVLLVDRSSIVLIVVIVLINLKVQNAIKKIVNIIKKKLVKDCLNHLMFVMVVLNEEFVH